MEKKAYDIKLLVEHFKEQGLDLAEEAAIKAFDGLASWVKESSQLSPNHYDDMLVGVALPEIEKKVKALIDKIDGEVG
jgi:hypothetical protein